MLWGEKYSSLMLSIHSRPQKQATVYVWIPGAHRIQVGFLDEGHDLYSDHVDARKTWLTRWQLEKMRTEWSHAKASLWEVHSAFGCFDHSVVAVGESWWHDWVGGEGICWRSINLFSRQIMSNGAGAVTQSWCRFASRVSHSCWYRQCSVCRRQ